MNDDDSLLTTEQVVRRLSLSRAKVYTLITSGELRSVKIGAARRIPSSAVNEFIANLKARAS